MNCPRGVDTTLLGITPEFQMTAKNYNNHYNRRPINKNTRQEIEHDIIKVEKRILETTYTKELAAALATLKYYQNLCN